MAKADFEIPKLDEYPEVPPVVPGTMAHSRPFVAKPEFQDPLNFPIKLNNRLASLRRSLETGDARPTDGAYQVFGELSAELEQHLGELNDILQKMAPQVNRVLKEAGVNGLNLSE